MELGEKTSLTGAQADWGLRYRIYTNPTKTGGEHNLTINNLHRLTPK
jgi:hypothetical protein